MVEAEKRAARWTFVLDEPTRILVVDDDPILREFATVYLSAPSATIDTADDGEAALKKLDAHMYDAVLMDIEMPRLDGFSVLARMRADETRRHLPVIMLTGHDDIASIDRAYQLGANSFASKPVNWRQLSYHIRYVIRANKLERIGGSARSNVSTQESDIGARGPTAAREVGDFLQSIVQRADTLAGRWAVDGDQDHLQIVRSIRLFAQQALAGQFGAMPDSQKGRERAYAGSARTVDADHAPSDAARPADALAS
jgi:DNA-binding response OmpR family regulator